MLTSFHVYTNFILQCCSFSAISLHFLLIFSEIPSPPVPSDVSGAGSVVDQIKAMRRWFIQFQNGDTSDGKDFHKFFPPVLSYVEGGWENVDHAFDDRDEKVNIELERVKFYLLFIFKPDVDYTPHENKNR